MTSQTYSVSGSGIVLANYNPVTIASGVTITGTSTQKSGDGIYGSAQSWTVVNDGTILGVSGGDGVELTAGGVLTNGQSGSSAGVIAGSRAVLIQNGVGLVTNYGTIVGTAGSYSDGVDLFAGGSVTNFGTILGTAAGSSFGVSSDGGSVVNGASGATAALILGAYAGVSLGGTAAGTVINFGTIASVYPGRLGVFLQTGGTVSNYGTIAGGPGGGDGIYTRAGASVTNARGGVIDTVAIARGPGTVVNLGTIAGIGTNSNAISLSSGIVVNGQSGASEGLIEGGYFAIVMGGAGTVVNFGTIAGTSGHTGAIRLDGAGSVANFGMISGGPASGVYMDAGGSVTNGRSGSAGGVIAGSVGVNIGGGGTVTNYGTIVGTAASYTDGVALHSGVVTNFGTILGTGAGGSVGVGIAAGTVINGASGSTSGLILGSYAGVAIGGTAGTVVNFGTIASVVPGRPGVFLDLSASPDNAGTVLNYGTIAGGPGGGDGIYTRAGASVTNAQGGVIDTVAIARGPGTVVNLGTIAGIGTNSNAISLSSGIVVNGQSGSTEGLIEGGYFAIVMGGAGTVVNFGTIAGTSGHTGAIRLDGAGSVANFGMISGGPASGVYMDAGGSVTNGRSGSGGGLITGSNGVNISAGPGTVANYGTIVGTAASYSNGIILDAGGSVANFGTILATGSGGSVGVGIGGGGTLVNGPSGATAALILGSYAGVDIGGTGTVINFGTIASVATGHPGMLLGAGGTVSNYGTIAGGPDGVGMYLRYGGDVTNRLSGVIIGAGSGVVIARAAGTVTNYGTIIATGSEASAVYIRYGVFVNRGLVEGAASGIVLGGTIAPLGTIGSTGTTTFASGVVSVSGTVSGAVGISTAPGITAGYTLTVGGTVISTAGSTGNAVLLGSGNNRVILAPGATFQGVVDGGVGGQNVLELDAGNYFLLATDKFKDFQTLKLDSQVTLAMKAGTIKFHNLINEGVLKAAKGDSFGFGKVSAAGTGIVELIGSGTVAFSGSVVHQRLDFVTVGGTAVIDDPKEFFGTITGFTAGDRIIVAPIVVGSGQTSGGNTLQIGFTETVLSGGTASGTTILAGGSERVFGTDIGARLRGGVETVSSSGVASATTVFSGGVERVYGRANGGAVASGGQQIVEAGGVANGAAVKNGGSEYVFAGGTARGTVLSGGIEYVHGTASGGTVSSGGRQIVGPGGVASGVTVKTGGLQYVYSGGVARATVVSGGSEIVSAGGSASGTTLSRGGSAIVYGKASGGTITGGRLEVASGGTASGTLTFISAGTLQLDPGAGFTGVIKGFGKPSLQDQIDLRGIAFGAGTTRSFVEAASGTSGTLTVTSGTHSVHLTLLGVYATSNFKLASDGHGGTLVTDPPAAGSLSLSYKGFNYVDYYNQEYLNNSLPAVAATGANGVALTPDWGIDVAESSIYAGGETTDTTNLATAIHEANQNGMTAFVRPLIDFLYNQKSTHGPINFNPGDYYVPPGPVDLQNLPTGQPDANGGTIPVTQNGTIPAGAGTDNYRGFLNPADINVPVFFGSPTTPGSYDYMIVKEAKTAAAAGATLFSVGTELDSLADNPAYTTYWNNLIADVRAAAPSLKLTFSANWSTASQVTFWNKLDFVGIDGYVPLSNTIPAVPAQNPSLASLIAGWNTPSNVTIAFSGGTTVSQTLNGHSAIDAFDTLAQSSISKKFIFTEIGYQNDTGAAADPTGGSNQGVTDPSLQAELYTAFFDAWGAAQQTANAAGGLVDGIPFALVGAYIWSWTPDRSNDDWSPGNPANSAALTPIQAGFATPSPPIVVGAGHTSSGVTVPKGVTEIVLSGGTARSTIILTGGSETISAGGKDFTAAISGKQIVRGTATSDTVYGGGNQFVAAGGTASATVVRRGGSETVSAGGVASGGTLASGGVERVYGRASGGTVSSGGRQIVGPGGVASGVTVKTGGLQYVYSGGVARATVVSGGSEIVSAGGSASGTTLSRGGSAIVYGKASGGTITGGRLEVASGGTASGTLTFISAGTLQLDPGAGFTGVIKGFGKPSLQDQIDLRGIAFGAGTTRSFAEAASGTSGTLTVTSGSHSVHLTLLGVYATSNFKLASDGHGGTLVTDPPAAAGAARTSFADIAPAQPRFGAPDPGSPLNPLPGAVAASLPAPAGALLLATGPPAGPGNADHNPLLGTAR